MFTEKDLIYKYTRREALDDGILIDISNMGREVGYKYPIAITLNVDDIINKAVANERYNDYNGVLWDILTMSKHPTKRIDETSHYFQVIITGVGRKHYHEFIIRCHPGDDLEPVLTIMCPEEV